MDYIDKPIGASASSIEELMQTYQVDLPISMIEWWSNSDGPVVFWVYKELQFFSVVEIIGEDIFELKQYMPNSMPICMDGNGNICVAKVLDNRVSGFYVVSCGDLGWDNSKIIAETFSGFINDKLSPESRLNA